MAKTKPIGVRFDEIILEMVKKDKNLETPQQVLSFYEKEYLSKGLTKEAKKEIVEVKINDLQKVVTTGIIVKADLLSEIPIKQENESWMEFAIRKAEWKEKQSKSDKTK